MATNGVDWFGTCAGRAERERLLTALAPFAEASSALFPEPAPDLRFDGPVEGTALLVPSHDVQETLRNSVADRESVTEGLRSTGGDLVTVERCWVADPLRTLWVVRLRNPVLHGIQWRVFDPRGLYPGYDFAGFVSLVLPSVPLLDGLLFSAQPDVHDEYLDDPVLGPAEWWFVGPHIVLRYYLESWFERFFAWVRFFHLPSLRTSCSIGDPTDPAWERLERHWRYRIRYAGLSRTELCARTARLLLEEFREEVAQWCDAGAVATGLGLEHGEDQYSRGGIPRRIEILRRLAERDVATGSVDKALRHLTLVLSLVPTRGRQARITLRRIAEIEASRGRWLEAEEAEEDASRADDSSEGCFWTEHGLVDADTTLRADEDDER